MENSTNDLIVNSKGHCFFCLDKIPFKMIPVKLEGTVSSSSPSSSSYLHQLHYLSQYLKMHLTKVFSQKESISPSLLAKVAQSRLKVELCEDCANLSETISSLCKRMEKLRMEIDFKLGHVQEKLLTADKLGRAEELRRSGWLEENEGSVEILEVLRTEAIDKCSNRRSVAPRVKIQKLTRKKIKARLRNRQDETKQLSEESMDTDSGPVLQSTHQVKLEDQKYDLLWNESGGNDFMDEEIGVDGDDDPASNEGAAMAEALREMKGVNDTSENENDENAKASNPIVTPSTSNKVGRRKYSINPKTGKYKCGLCSKELGQSGFHYHYESVHLKIRYKCDFCKKVFSSKPPYNRHLRSSDLGVRFNCCMCKRQFTSKQGLNQHQQKKNCKLEEPS